MLTDRERRYVASLEERFACPISGGKLLSMKECVYCAIGEQQECCRLAACTSPWRLCPDCLDQGENVDPGINRIDCFVFDGERCDFHERHGRLACRDNLFRQSIKNLLRVDRRVVEKGCWQLAENGEWEQVPEWHSVMFGVSPLLECETLPELGGKIMPGIVVSIKIKSLPRSEAPFVEKLRPPLLEREILPEPISEIESDITFSIKSNALPESVTPSIEEPGPQRQPTEETADRQRVKRPRKPRLPKKSASAQTEEQTVEAGKAVIEGFSVTSVRPWPQALEAAVDHLWAPLEEIRPSVILGSADYDEAVITLAADELRRQGQHECCLAIRQEGWGGKYELLQPEKWWLAARAAGIDKLAITVIDFESEDEFRFCLAALNPWRFNDFELGRIILAIKRKYGLSNERLAKPFGYSPSWVGSHLYFLQQAPEVQAWVEAIVPAEDRITCTEAVKYLLHVPKQRQWHEIQRLLKRKIR
jgi:hypothetical protein